MNLLAMLPNEEVALVGHEIVNKVLESSSKTKEFITERMSVGEFFREHELKNESLVVNNN